MYDSLVFACAKRDAINKLASKSIAIAIYAAARFEHAQEFMTLRLDIASRTEVPKRLGQRERGAPLFLLFCKLNAPKRESTRRIVSP